MERHASAGQLALTLEQPAQAVRQFRDGLARARERDDAAAIADLGFDLSVAQLQVNEPEATLKTATEVEAELARRGVPPPPGLLLAHAVALYRTDQRAAADKLAMEVAKAADRDAAARAVFLRGLIADDRGDAAGLRTAVAGITGVSGPEHQADVAELSARLALRDGDPRTARARAAEAADLRRELVDYRALGRGLALEARAAELSGDTAGAADLYLRAGRTAAAQGDTAAAKRRLEAAIALSRDPVLTQAARALLAAPGGR